MTLTAALALSTPVAVHAATAHQGLDACAQALTESLAKNQGAPLRYRLGLQNGFDDRFTGNPARRLSGETVFLVDARDPGNHQIVARAECLVNARAVVVQLKPMPVEAGGDLLGMADDNR